MRGQGLGRLSAAEQAVWELDQRINARGIAIDVGFVEAAKRIADRQMGEVIAEFAQLTGDISPHQVQKTREWLKGRGCVLPNLDSETVGDALELAGLPDDVRRVLEIRQITAATSLKKLDAMLACVGADGRARGLLQYHGAATGRWSGQLIQPQNFPRPTLEADVDPEELAAAVKTGDPERLRCWGKPIDVLVSGLRHALTAADGALIGAGDFSMIECCVLLALAGQQDKCELIAQGVDVYRDMAATIYGLDRAAFMAIPEDQLSPEETEQRRIGKNGVLSSGYGIGAEGFYRRFCRTCRRRPGARRPDRRRVPQSVGAGGSAAVARSRMDRAPGDAAPGPARRRSLRRRLSTDDPRRAAVPDLRVAQREIAALRQRPD